MQLQAEPSFGRSFCYTGSKSQAYMHMCVCVCVYRVSEIVMTIFTSVYQKSSQCCVPGARSKSLSSSKRGNFLTLCLIDNSTFGRHSNDAKGLSYYIPDRYFTATLTTLLLGLTLHNVPPQFSSLTCIRNVTGSTQVN